MVRTKLTSSCPVTGRACGQTIFTLFGFGQQCKPYKWYKQQPEADDMHHGSCSSSAQKYTRIFNSYGWGGDMRWMGGGWLQWGGCGACYRTALAMQMANSSHGARMLSCSKNICMLEDKNQHIRWKPRTLQAAKLIKNCMSTTFMEKLVHRTGPFLYFLSRKYLVPYHIHEFNLISIKCGKPGLWIKFKTKIIQRECSAYTAI